MNKLYIILLIYLFSILLNGVNTLKCDGNLSDKGLKDLTLTTIFNSHSHDIDNLLIWVHFFFYHFSYNHEIVWYLEHFNINSIDPIENKCFKRGLTIFLIYFYVSELELITKKKGRFYAFEHTFKHINREIISDFLESIRNYKILNIVYTIKIPQEDTINFHNRALDLKNNIDLSTIKLEDIYYKHKEYTIKLLNKKKYKNIKYDMLIENSIYMHIANLKNLNVRSDLTLNVMGVQNFMEKSTRLLIRNRSKTFKLDDDLISDAIFGNCIKNKKGKEHYYNSVDDLVSSFFSIMKKKMLLGYEKFLKEFNNAVKKKNYKLERLKGLRYIQYYFRKNSFNHFIKIHLNLISIEHKFLTRDFINLFNITMSCYDEVKSLDAESGYLHLLVSMKQ